MRTDFGQYSGGLVVWWRGWTEMVYTITFPYLWQKICSCIAL